ncbi:MAG: ABC transporter permease [Gemmatimonadaceae bacterium]
MSRARRLVRLTRLSVELLVAHRLRTALSVSGMVVGTATVMVMVAVGRGTEQRIVQRVLAIGTDLVVVTSPAAPRVAARQRQVATATALRSGDASAILESSAAAEAAAPVVQRAVIVKWSDRNANVPLVGTTVDGLRIRGIRAEAGRVFGEDEDREHRRVALIGPTVARALFGGRDPIGSEIRIGAASFDVIGVTAPRGTDIGGTDLDNEVVIPIETAMRRVLNVPYVDALFVRARRAELLDQLETEVNDVLRTRHPARAGVGAVHPFVVQNQATVLRTHRSAARAINRMIVSVSVLALVVGSIGVLAVMLLAAGERVREIGLRRAVGASRRDIQTQFLLESALLAAAGGTLGVIAGCLIAALASGLGRWELAFSWSAACAGVVTSALCGILAGVIPAARAVHLEPMSALRS